MKFAPILLFLLVSNAYAQSPANATGICKDGSFTTSAVKDGACRGHKGIQTWYNPSLPALPAPTSTTLPGRQAPSVTAASSALPAPTASPSASLPAPAAKPSLESRPAATPAQAPAARPAPTQAPAAPAMPAPHAGQKTESPGIATERANLANMPQAEGGGPGLVWVNSSSKVYHCPGSDFYGKTKSGAYMTEAEAKAQGAHPNRNKPCA